MLRVGEALGFGSSSITIARLLSLAALGLSTIALAGLVSEILPGRPQAWIGATAVLMGLPGVTQLGAVLYSDTTALAAGLVAMWGAVRILRLGPSTTRLCATGAAIALCGMVRFSALALAAVPLALLLVGLLHTVVKQVAIGCDPSDGRHRRRHRRGGCHLQRVVLPPERSSLRGHLGRRLPLRAAGSAAA